MSSPSLNKPALTYGYKKSADPSIHYSGLALPLYTMVKPAPYAHAPLCIVFALIFSAEVQVRVVNVSNMSAFLTDCATNLQLNSESAKVLSRKIENAHVMHHVIL